MYLHIKKTSKRVKCGDTGKYLNGIKRVRPFEMKWLKQRQRKVTFVAPRATHDAVDFLLHFVFC